MSLNSLPTIFIQSSKVLTWLIERKVVFSDFLQEIAKINKKIELAQKDLPELFTDFKEPTPYLQAMKQFEELSKTDTKTDILGRSSKTVRVWKEILDMYKKNKLYLAETADAIYEISSTQIPRLRTTMSDQHKLILNLQSKSKELVHGVQIKEELYNKSLREFKIKDKHIRLRLLEEARDIFEFLNIFVLSLKDLKPALTLYTTFTNYMLASLKEDNSDKVICCQTLSLLIEKGHVLVYTYKNAGREPKIIKKDNCNIDILLEQEKKRIAEESNVSKDENVISWDNETDNGIDEVANDAAIDFGDTEIELGDENDTIGIEFDSGVLADNHNSGCGDSDETAIGESARRLLDSLEGRRALMADLVELYAFLKRFYDDIEESTSGSTGGLGVDSGGTLCQLIMQNAPAEVRDITRLDIEKMLEIVKLRQDELTNPTLTHLCMLRCRSGYLERLVNRLADLQRQVELAKGRVAEASLRSEAASCELRDADAIMTTQRANCLRLVELLELELSTIYKREVKIIGQVLDM